MLKCDNSCFHNTNKFLNLKVTSVLPDNLPMEMGGFSNRVADRPSFPLDRKVNNALAQEEEKRQPKLPR